jgi:hypothetical protein
MKFNLILFFTCTFFLKINAQENQSDKIIDRHKLAFANIYLASKKLKVNVDSMVNITFKNSGLSDQRIQEILVSGFNLENVLLNKDEANLKAQLQKLQLYIDKVKLKRLQELCFQEKLELDIYHFMASEFKNNLQFQNEMKPFFKKVIEGL